jgi:MFS family permease
VRLLERIVPSRLGTSFRWLLASSWTSNLGEGIFVAAGPLLVASLTGNPFLISLAALLRWAPKLVFGLYAGVLSDRLDRRRIVIIADGSRVLILAALVSALLTHRLSPAAALVAFGLLATAEVFADNTTGTLPPMLVARDDLALANSRVFFGFATVNQLIGPAVGAALFATGRAYPVVAQTLLVAAGVLLVTRVRLPAHARDANEQRRSLRQEIAQGLRWTLQHAAVRTLILTILIFNVTFGAAWSVLVLYAQRQLGLGAVGFGLVTTVQAVGGVLGTIAYGWITKRISLGNLMRIGLIVETLTHLALAVTTVAWVAMVVFCVFGAHAFIWGTTSMTVRQRAIPGELQGRVNSLNTIGTFGGLVVGSVIGGVLATRLGVTAPFWFGFGGSALFVVLLWRQLTNIAHADDGAVAPELAPAQT